MRKFRRADELAAEGKAGEEVAAALGSGGHPVQRAPPLWRDRYRRG